LTTLNIESVLLIKELLTEEESKKAILL
jgi:hypothetical protein